MKNIFLILSVFLSIAIVSCNTSTKQQEKDVREVIQPVTAEIDVEGMTCTGCENTINKSIEELEGIVEVSSSHVDKKTVVTFDDEKTSIDQIKEAIQKSGYQVVDPDAIE